MQEHPLLESVRLENGLVLNLYDRSRQIAEDRWYVLLVADMDIPVDLEEKRCEDVGGGGVEALREKLGDTVRFEKKMERNFIDAKEKMTIIHEMVSSFKNHIVPYLSHRDFAEKFILKQLLEYERRPSLPV